MTGRWQVQKTYGRWQAVNPACTGPRLGCRCRTFPTWREAFDFADRGARAEAAA